MAIWRPRARAVYQVYSEEAYLAGADGLGEWDAPPVKRVSREGRLRPLAGAAALTGAVAAVGGVIVLTGIGMRSPDRQIAASSTPRILATLPGAGRTGSAGAARRADASRRGHGYRAGVAARRSATRDRWHVGRRSVLLNAARSAMRLGIAASAQAAASPIGSSSTAATYPRLAAHAEVAAKSIQSEFGFER